MAKPDEHAFRRVIVALDAFAGDAAAIESAAAVAARLRAEIAGLFVEDIDLLRLAGLRCARQVSLLTAAEELFAPGAIERQLRMLAGQAQVRIAAAAARRSVRWSFRTVRGKIEAELPAAIEASDLLVVLPAPSRRSTREPGLRRRVIACTAGPILLLPPVATLGESALVYYDGSDAAERALEIARLLLEPGTVLSCLVAADTEAATRDLEARVRAGGTPAEITQVVPATAAALRAALAQAPTGPLVLAAGCVFANGEPVAERIDDRHRPLLLVR